MPLFFLWQLHICELGGEMGEEGGGGLVREAPQKKKIPHPAGYAFDRVLKKKKRPHPFVQAWCAHIHRYIERRSTHTYVLL